MQFSKEITKHFTIILGVSYEHWSFPISVFYSRQKNAWFYFTLHALCFYVDFEWDNFND